jgi:transposase
VAGVARLHELIGAHLDEDGDPAQVAIGIETDRGPWVQALLAAGYRVYAVNPRQVSRFRDRHGPSGAKSDTADAHTLADMVHTDRHQLRTVAGDSGEAQAAKVVARAHQTLIWDRHRHMLRLRAALREFFPAALAAFADLTASDALELLSKAPDPARAARLSRTQVSAALKRARRRDVDAKAEAIVTALAQRAADPAAGRRRSLRRHGAVAKHDHRHLQQPDRRAREAGDSLFWANPRRRDLPEPAGPGPDPGGSGSR